MAGGSAAPPLPSPLHPATTARVLSETARAAAEAWAQPMDTTQFNRAISQLYSFLRDLGIAIKVLARYQTIGNPADPAPLGFARHVQACAQWLLDTWQSLDGVLVAEGFGPVPDPDEPGAVLCQAVRTAITAWRQPTGTSTDRDATMEQLVAAIGFLATAARNLAEYAPRQRTIELLAVSVGLAEATACLRRAVQAPADDAALGSRTDDTADGDRERATTTSPMVSGGSGTTGDMNTVTTCIAERGEDRMTSNGTWTPEAIRALGPTTDLPTLGTIFKCSRWKSYQMARQGEWERVGIKVIPIGSKYRVVVQSILDVLGYGRSDVGTQEALPLMESVRSSEETYGSPAREPSRPVAARTKR